MTSTEASAGALSVEGPQGAQNGPEKRLPKFSSDKSMKATRKASVSLHNDADLESGIKDQLASVSNAASFCRKEHFL